MSAAIIFPATATEPARQVPYVPPAIVPGNHWIVQRETGLPILVTPGGTRDTGKTRPGPKGKPEPIIEPQPFRLLKDPHDWMHATAMTLDSARVHVAIWKLDPKQFKITNLKPRK